jgi:recombination protein RecA
MAKSKTETREARITRICGSINKSAFGGDNGDAVTYMGSRDIIPLRRFPSGCPDLDDALGGGWPKGRFVEVYGPESGGKTTLVCHAIAEHQKMFPDEDCALIDAEYAFDEEYASALGVDMRYVIVHQPDSGEQALNILELLIKDGVSFIAVDSVAALTTRAELEGDIGDIHVAQQARLMSGALKRLTTEAGKRGATVFWTNQLRDKIGVTFGERTVTPAGRALKHYASIRVNVARIGTVREGPKDNQTAVSNKTKADVKKNKTAPPFRRAEFCITYGIGIDLVAAILDGAIAHKVVEKRGSWLSFDGENIGQGRPSVLDMLRTNDELFEKIEAALKAAKDSGVKATESVGGNFKKPKAADSSKAAAAEKKDEAAPAIDTDAVDGGAAVVVQDA